MVGPAVNARAPGLSGGSRLGFVSILSWPMKLFRRAAFGAAGLPQKAHSTNGLTGGYLTLLYIIRSG